MTEKSQRGNPANEGEGNKTAARNYNEAQHRFVKSGRVDEKAREAGRAIDGPEREDLEDAEAAGKAHMAEEDREVEDRGRSGQARAKNGK